MSARNRKSTLCACLLLSLPLALPGQAIPQAVPQAPSASVDGWIAELMEIQIQLAPIEERAMQDATLVQEQDALGDEILAAMVQADPAVEAKLERLRAIMMEAQAAGGDVARLEALAGEAQTIQPHVERARAQALARPEIETRMATFRKSLSERMAQIAPESRQLISRFEELERMIRSSVRQPTSPAPGRGR